tara:strand:- start:959 stop:1483 length:525 start_codon:yes stop_codon:yes gene_type:complete
MLQIKIVSDFLNDIIFEYSNIEELKEKFNKFNDINNYILSNLEIFDEENNKLDNSNIKILVNSDGELGIQQIDINTLNEIDIKYFLNEIIEINLIYINEEEETEPETNDEPGFIGGLIGGLFGGIITENLAGAMHGAMHVKLNNNFNGLGGHVKINGYKNKRGYPSLNNCRFTK